MSHKHGRDGRPKKPPKVRRKVIHECPSCGGNYQDGQGVKISIDNRERGVKGHATFCTEECAYRTFLEGRMTALQPPILIDRRTGKPVKLPPQGGPIIGGPGLRLPQGGSPTRPPPVPDEHDEDGVDLELEEIRAARAERMKKREEG